MNVFSCWFLPFLAAMVTGRALSVQHAHRFPSRASGAILGAKTKGMKQHGQGRRFALRDE
jgi:hypothetical protein